MNKQTKAYDLLAKDYDLLIGSRTAEGRFLVKVAEQYCRKGAHVLEIACGTGELLHSLGKRYYIEGLDISPRMIACAKRKFKAVKFHVGDMRSFRLKRKFDFIFCLFDSINHLKTLRDWEKTFESVQRHLSEGGIFVFDINTPYKVRNMVTRPPLGFWLSEHKAVLLRVVNPRGEFFNWEIDLLTCKKSKTRFNHQKIIIEEYVPSVEAVRKMVRRTFSKITLHDPQFARVNAKTERVYFVCRR